jgi:hypothetical protein
VKFEIDPKSSSNNLVIPKISQVAHSGKYTIKASNIVGEAEHKFEVEILGNLRARNFSIILSRLFNSSIFNDILFNF